MNVLAELNPFTSASLESPSSFADRPSQIQPSPVSSAAAELPRFVLDETAFMQALEEK